eukprot:397886_1
MLSRRLARPLSHGCQFRKPIISRNFCSVTTVRRKPEKSVYLSKQGVFNKICVILNSMPFVMDNEPLTGRTKFGDDLYFDDIDMIAVVEEFEKEFGIGIKNWDYEQDMITVNDAVNMIITYMEARDNHEEGRELYETV